MAVSFEDVVAAHERMQGKLHTTQVLESLALNNMCGGRVLVKAEALQKTGTFKIRGALNRVLCLTAEEKAAGVVAFSSGNFGQGLAAAATSAGVSSTIVMPGDAPANKQARARSYGAKVVLSEIIEGENREITAARLAEKIAKEEGRTLLHPFEDYDVIAGQGTAALELAQYCAEIGVETLDDFLVCTGGGGLTAGCVTVLSKLMPSCRLYSVEPEAYDDHARSFHAPGKTIQQVEGNPVSICDALQAAAPGQNTWPINSKLLTDVLTVTDDEVRFAMRVAFETLQLVLEPSGAVSLAAVLSGKVSAVGKTIGVIASGGNLDVAKFAKVLGCPGSSGGSGGSTGEAPPVHYFDWTGFETVSVPGLTRPLVAIKTTGANGFLGCGYFSIEGMDKIGEVGATVAGVATPVSMLDAHIVGVSKAALQLGVRTGMLGRDALEIMRSRASKL